MRVRTVTRVFLSLVLLLPAACASCPRLVMVNPATQTTVDCPMPDFSADSGGFLVSRECVAACQAHGFRPQPGATPVASDSAIPPACEN